MYRTQEVPMTPLAQELMNGLIVEDKIDMTQEEIDRYSDHEEDEPMKPVHGQKVRRPASTRTLTTWSMPTLRTRSI